MDHVREDAQALDAVGGAAILRRERRSSGSLWLFSFSNLVLWFQGFASRFALGLTVVVEVVAVVGQVVVGFLT